MPNDFKYDVFLSHSSKDKSRHGDGMRELANYLKKDKLRVFRDPLDGNARLAEARKR